jgi:hypothetical protein
LICKVSFKENGTEAEFVLVIDGLKVQRQISSGFSKMPKNGQIINQILNDQSVNFCIEIVNPKVVDSRKVYRFEVKRLPTQINPEKTKFKVR